MRLPGLPRGEYRSAKHEGASVTACATRASKTRLALLTLLILSAAAQAEPVTYRVDPTHTFVTFEARHFDTSTLRGRFDRQQGVVTMDRQARTGRAEITVDTASVSTGVPALDERLRGEGFLDSARFPQAQFTGERFSFEGDKVSAVAGTLALRDKTLPVTLRATRFGCYLNPLLRREVCGGDFETAFSPSAWGMRQGLDPGVPDSIRLLVQIEAVRQDPATEAVR